MNIPANKKLYVQVINLIPAFAIPEVYFTSLEPNKHQLPYSAAEFSIEGPGVSSKSSLTASSNWLQKSPLKMAARHSWSFKDCNGASNSSIEALTINAPCQRSDLLQILTGMRLQWLAKAWTRLIYIDGRKTSILGSNGRQAIVWSHGHALHTTAIKEKCHSFLIWDRDCFMRHSSGFLARDTSQCFDSSFIVPLSFWITPSGLLATSWFLQLC